MDDLKIFHERYPSGDARKASTPIQEMVDRVEPEHVEVVRKRIIFDYRPLYVIAFVLCFGMFLAAAASTVSQLSANATAQACFAAGGSWQIGDQGVSECTQK